MLLSYLTLLPLSLAATYTVNHRVLSTTGSGEFTKYGTIDVPDEYDPSTIIRIDRSGSELTGNKEGWYQVQLTGEGTGDSLGLISSTKACYLNAGPASLVIHRSSLSSTISSIDLIPYPSVPIDGSCPSSPSSRSTSENIAREVMIKTPNLVFGPDLSPPMPIPTAGADGKPIPPPVEKSFIQKYWLPMLGVGFFVISQMAPEEPKPAAAAGGAAAK